MLAVEESAPKQSRFPAKRDDSDQVAACGVVGLTSAAVQSVQDRSTGR